MSISTELANTIVDPRAYANGEAVHEAFRTIRKTAPLAKAQRASEGGAIVRALEALAPDGLTVDTRPSGMHLVIRSVRPEPDIELARRARAGGFAVHRDGEPVPASA